MPGALRVGEQVRATVRKLLPPGLLVELPDGRTALIRERELAWSAADRLRWQECYRPGDVITAVVSRSDPRGDIELSLRLIEANPWRDLADRYAAGQLTDGIVTGVEPYGAFVELDCGVTGLLHTSRLPEWAVGAPADLFWPGDHVKVTVEHIDPNRRRLALSMAGLAQQRWQVPATAPIPAFILSVGQPRHSNPQPTPTPARLLLERLLRERPRSVLVVEDDPAQLQALAGWLRHAGQQVTTADSGERALALGAEAAFDIVLMDVGLGGMNGIEAVRRLRSVSTSTTYALITDWGRADAHRDDLDELRAAGVRLLLKPLLPEDLLEVLNDIPPATVLRRPQESALLGQTGAFFGARAADQSRAVQNLLAQLRRSSRAGKAVLFGLDPARRTVQVVAESGSEALQLDALPDLIHSPVREVAEDGETVEEEDIFRSSARRFRYLTPLLPFVGCLGVPVPAALANRYALFLFYPRAWMVDVGTRQDVAAIAAALGALLESQIVQAQTTEIQRLALLGQLTRSLVHEMSNRLGPINFSLEALEDRCVEVETLLGAAPAKAAAEVRLAREHLGALSQAARSLTETTRLFREMTRPGSEQLLQLDDVVHEVAQIVHDTADQAHVVIEAQRPPELLFARAQITQAQQIVLNILLNAIQQIALLRPQRGGRVQVRFGQERRDGKVLIQMLVEDDGPGIHRQHWERIFEPGFTTRADGSGLGLYISRNLAIALGGRIFVAESCQQWGTTVALELPFQV